ncbi:MAG: hypothetical protein IPG79_07385 [Saprospiraceae bacterium]|nr:hypothetical protein [Saprospiraceae bacterium]
MSFRAKASANRVISVFTDLGASPFTTYLYQDVNLTTTSQTYTFTYTQNATTTLGRIGFNLGQSSQTVWVDNILFYDVCMCPSSIPVAGTITQPTCSNSTGSVVLNGLPSSGTWTITRSPGNVTYTGTGTSYTVTGLPAMPSTHSQ